MIYIDDFNAPFGRMTMCHMIADSTEELLLMADKIGVQRKWIQEKGTPREHFDICLSMKKKAIAYGAKEIGMRELASMTSKREAPPAKLNKALVIKSVCPVCDGKGYYFVNEWMGSLQGRKDCKCKGQTVL